MNRTVSFVSLRAWQVGFPPYTIATFDAEFELSKPGAYGLRIADGGDDETFSYNLSVQCFGVCPPQTVPVSRSTRILPQLAFGGGWYSALYFANTSDQPASINLAFFSDDGQVLTNSLLRSSSGEMGICLTQVTPTCSIRG